MLLGFHCLEILHVHTTYSFDAYIFGTLATPDDAYEFAKGKPIKHPAGFDVSLDRPLDFYGVTDHGTFLGQVAEAATPGNPYYDAPSSAQVNDLNSPENLKYLQHLIEGEKPLVVF